MEYSDLIKSLQAARIAQGLLQADVARNLGITQGMFSKYENEQAAVAALTLVAWGKLLGLQIQLQTAPATAQAA